MHFFFVVCIICSCLTASCSSSLILNDSSHTGIKSETASELNPRNLSFIPATQARLERQEFWTWLCLPLPKPSNSLVWRVGRWLLGFGSTCLSRRPLSSARDGGAQFYPWQSWQAGVSDWRKIGCFFCLKLIGKSDSLPKTKWVVLAALMVVFSGLGPGFLQCLIIVWTVIFAY